MIPPLHVVASDEQLGSDGFEDAAAKVLTAGGSDLVLHLRPRSTPARETLARARRIRNRVPAGRIGINDRIDIALAGGFDWVHLGERSLPPAVARELLDPTAVVGRSIHSVDEARSLGGLVDYLIAGNVYETRSHPDREGRGTGWLAEVVSAAPVPVVAIGGVTPERVTELLGAGAQGVAVLSGVWRTGDPGSAVSHYLEALRRQE